MTRDSEIDHGAINAIDTIIEYLCDEKITREIEDPIAAATGDFQMVISEPITHGTFNTVISEFIKHLYGKAHRFPRQLSEREALAEAIHLLGRFSDAPGPDRYGAIVARVIAGGHEALKSVLVQLAKLVKEIEKGKYIHWALTCHFHNLEMEAKYRMVDAYKKLKSPILPPIIKNMNPGQMVEYFPDIIMADVRYRNMMWHQQKAGNSHVFI
jgi:hypothetical protein